jgi:hypothetical protein
MRRGLSGPGALVACALAALVAVACAEPAPRPAPRILLVAADGLDWKVALPLVAAGRMPELRRLMERGSYGVLRTEDVTVSPIIWTSIATGKTPAKHGVHGFALPAPGGGTRLYTSLDRKPKAFWNVLSDYRRRVHVVGWWLTYPVEEIDGVMVAQNNTALERDVLEGQAIRKGSVVAGAPGQVHPREREPAVFRRLEQVEKELPAHLVRVFGEPALRDDPGIERLWRASEWALRADSLYAALALDLAAEGDFELLAVYIGGTDVVGHRFWRFFEPASFAHPPAREQCERYGTIIPAYYAFLDRTIGDLVRATPGEPTVFVIADHGMEAFNRESEFAPDAPFPELISGGHPGPLPGVFVAAGPGIRRAGAASLEPLTPSGMPVLGTVRDVAPTLYALLDLPMADDMDGAALAQVLEPEVLESWSAAPVISHDTTDWFAARLAARRAEVDDSERMRQLRELGYVE